MRNKATINGELEDAGKWITEQRDFRDWLSSRDSCSIWLRGDLGTGKTVLTSTVVDHVGSLYGPATQGAMAFYYCSGAAKPSDRDILAGILRQLVATDVGFDIYKNWKDDPKSRHLTNKAMKQLIVDMVERSPSQTTIIIDALDEADEDSCRYVLGVLEDLMHLGSGLVKVFVSSRREGHIETELGSWSAVTLQSALTERDMEKYIGTRVDQSLRLREAQEEKKTSLRKEVKSFLLEGANGV